MRRTLSTLLILSAVALPAFAAPEMRAITEDGRKVLLSRDGKWRFDSNVLPALTPQESGSPYQTAVKRFKVAFSTNDWILLPKKDTDEANKRTFQHKTYPLYAMVIADEMPAATPMVKSVILANAKSTAQSVTVLTDETQQVNGKEVGAIKFAAAVKGLEFVFQTYYYADTDGNIQVTCFTGQTIFFKYQAECQKFLGGLTIQ
ncbi:MAG: hypothetical protein ACM3SV_08110 [Betaproteobacteria bacterium]